MKFAASADLGKRLLGVLLAIGVVLLMPLGAIAANLSAAPDNARTYIVSPKDGETVPEEFTVVFGLSGMGIAPAGFDKDGTGHHHLLIDVDELPPLTEPLAATANVRHFGGGQTEATLDLPAGEHTLQLLLGNYTHVPHNKPVLSDKIEITVK